MKWLLGVVAVCLLAGCDDADNPVAATNALQKPVVVIATSKDDGTVLAGADGKIVFVGPNNYMHRAISDSGYKPKDILIPALPDKPLPAVEKALVEPR